MPYYVMVARGVNETHDVLGPFREPHEANAAAALHGGKAFETPPAYPRNIARCPACRRPVLQQPRKGQDEC